MKKKRVSEQLPIQDELLSIEEIEQVEGGISSLTFVDKEEDLSDTNYALCGGNGYCPKK